MKHSILKRCLCYILAVSCALSGLVMPARLAYAEDPVAIVYQFLTQDMGLNSAAACGVMANIEKESSFNPHLSVLDTNGKYTLGICQWNGGRKTSLERFAGEESRTVEGQLKFLKYELFSSEYSAWNHMGLNAIPNTAEGAGEAARRWAKFFERCAAYYCPSTNAGYSYFHCMSCRDQYQERISLAQNKYWILYGDGSSDSGSVYSSYSYSNAKAGKSALESKQNQKSSLYSNNLKGKKDTDQVSKSSKSLKLTLEQESDTPVLSSVQSSYKVGDPVALVRNKVSGASTYEVEVWKDDKLVFGQTMKKDSIQIADLEEGTYTAFLRVTNKQNGMEISEPYLFNLQEEVTDMPTVFTVKTLYDYNEPITLIRNYVAHTSYYWVTVWRDNKKILEQNMVEPTLELEHPIAGNYKITLQVGNSVSGQIISDAFEFQVAEHDHVWNEGKVTKEATDTENGVITYTCSCLATYTEPIPAKGHN